jgi:hypothetical protein
MSLASLAKRVQALEDAVDELKGENEEPEDEESAPAQSSKGKKLPPIDLSAVTGGRSSQRTP